MQHLLLRLPVFTTRLSLFGLLALAGHTVRAEVNETIYWHTYGQLPQYYYADVSSFDSIDVTVYVICDTDFDGDEFEIIDATGARLYYFDAGVFWAPPRPAGTVFTYSVHGPSGPAGNGPRFNPNSLPTQVIPAALRSYTYGTIVGYATGGAVTINYGQVANSGPSTHYTATATIHVGLGPTPAPTPTPTPGANTKCNDDKSGGNSNDCQTCSGGQTGSGDNHGMARYSVHSMLVSLNVQDTPLRYSPPIGPAIDFSVTYNQGPGKGSEPSIDTSECFAAGWPSWRGLYESSIRARSIMC